MKISLWHFKSNEIKNGGNFKYASNKLMLIKKNFFECLCIHQRKINIYREMTVANYTRNFFHVTKVQQELKAGEFPTP